MVKIQMKNGEEMELSVVIGKLYRFKDDEKYKNYVEEYFTMLNGSVTQDSEQTVFWDAVSVLYVAYLCQHVKDGEVSGAVEYLDFVDMLPDDPDLICTQAINLLHPNRNRDSGQRSKSQQKRQSNKE